MLQILAVNPAVDRGKKMRDLTMADMVMRSVSVPGTFTLMDMLSDESIRNAIAVYTAGKN